MLVDKRDVFLARYAKTVAVRYDTTLNLWHLDRTSRTWHRIPEAEGELLYGSKQH